MKRILNSGTLAVMIFGLGPLALIFWSLGVSGETILTMWIIAGVVVKIAMSSKKD